MVFMIDFNHTITDTISRKRKLCHMIWADNELVSLENTYCMFNYFKIIEFIKTQIWNIFIP